MDISNNSNIDALTFRNTTFDMTSIGDCTITSFQLSTPSPGIILSNSVVQISNTDTPRKLLIETDGAVVFENDFRLFTLESIDIPFNFIISCNEFINKHKQINCIFGGDANLQIINTDPNDNELFNYSSIDNLNSDMFQIAKGWTGSIVLRGLNNVFAKQYLLDNKIVVVIDGSPSDVSFTWDDKYLTIKMK